MLSRPKELVNTGDWGAFNATETHLARQDILIRDNRVAGRFRLPQLRLARSAQAHV